MRAKLAVSMAALITAACAPTGDFGRPAPGIFHDGVLPAIGVQAAQLRGEPVSRFNLTDDEQRLRTIAYTIVEPHRQGQREDRLFHEFRHQRLAPLAAGGNVRGYYETLSREPFASSEARFSALVYAVRTDEDRLTPFFSLAARVYEADKARRITASRLPDLTAREAADAEARINENVAIIAWVRSTLLHRVDAYDYALQRLALETPSLRLRAGEAALATLRARLANPLGLIAVGYSQETRGAGGGTWGGSAHAPGGHYGHGSPRALVTK